MNSDNISNSSLHLSAVFGSIGYTTFYSSGAGRLDKQPAKFGIEIRRHRRFMRIFLTLCCTLLTKSMATDIRAPRASREKVMLKPGFHLVDWMRLTQVSSDMRSPGPLRKISLAELATHKSKYDAWTAYKGKVYNITQYMAYHPGGEKQLMAGAGKDCTAQFNKFHAWVNAESMLAKCLIGVLMSEEAAIAEAENENDDDEEIKAASALTSAIVPPKKAPIDFTDLLHGKSDVGPAKSRTISMSLPPTAEYVVETKPLGSSSSLKEDSNTTPTGLTPSTESAYSKIHEVTVALNHINFDDDKK